MMKLRQLIASATIATAAGVSAPMTALALDHQQVREVTPTELAAQFRQRAAVEREQANEAREQAAEYADSPLAAHEAQGQYHPKVVNQEEEAQESAVELERRAAENEATARVLEVLGGQGPTSP